MNDKQEETFSSRGIPIRYAMDIAIISVLVVMALNVFFFMGKTLNERTKVFQVNGDTLQHIDYVSLYSAACLARSNDRLRIYDPQAQLDWYNKIIYPHRVSTQCLTQYPPYFFPLMEAFTIFPLRESFIIWNAIGVMGGALALLLAGKVEGKLSIHSLVLTIGFYLASFPACDAILDGQTSWYFLIFFTLFFVALKTANHFGTGLFCALLALKPHFFLMSVPACFLNRNKNVLLSLILSLLGLLLIAGFAVGFENLLKYPDVLLHAETGNTSATLFPERMTSLRGICTTLLPPTHAHLFTLLGFIAGLIGVTWIWFKAIAKHQMQLNWAMALSIILILITSPHLHIYDCVLIVLAAVITLPTIRLSRVMTLKSLALRAWSLILLSYPLLSWLMMTAVPFVCSRIFPPALQEITAVNGKACLLTTFYAYCILHIVLLICGFLAAEKNEFHVPANGHTE